MRYAARLPPTPAVKREKGGGAAEKDGEVRRGRGGGQGGCTVEEREAAVGERRGEEQEAVTGE